MPNLWLRGDSKFELSTFAFKFSKSQEKQTRYSRVPNTRGEIKQTLLVLINGGGGGNPSKKLINRGLNKWGVIN